MRTPEIEVLVYSTRDGRCPLDEWLHALKDRRARAKIRARIARAQRYWREHRNANSPLS